MLYIKNNLDYSVAFTVTKDSKETKFVFGCFVQYADTGNVASTGVTDISESDFDFLMDNCKQFKKFIETGKLSKTKESGAVAVSNKIDVLEKENAELKAELEAKTKEASTATSEATKKLEKENASLKAQLEALANKSKKKSGDDF